MPAHSSLRFSRTPSTEVAIRLGPRGCAALVAASARMALADGSVQPVEPHGLLRFLRQTDMPLALGRPEIKRRLAAELIRAAARQPAGEADREQFLVRLGALAGMRAAGLIAIAAARVAAADGILHPAEAELLLAMRKALGLAAEGVAA